MSTTAEEVMEDGSGWFADPDIEGQERYFDGAEWTSETRLIESDVPALHLPDHVPELQRALAAATADIDEVEARLGLLFDRAEGVDPEVAKARRGAGLTRRAEAKAAAAAAAAAEAAEAAAAAAAEAEVEVQAEVEVEVKPEAEAEVEAEVEVELAAEPAQEAEAEVDEVEEPELELIDDEYDEYDEPELELIDDEDDETVVAAEVTEAPLQAEPGVEAAATAAHGAPTVESLLGTDGEDAPELEPELEFVDDEELEDDDDFEEDVDVADAVHEAFADDDLDEEVEDEDDDDEIAGGIEDEVDDDAIADLDEALASEEPEKLKRGRFRRR